MPVFALVHLANHVIDEESPVYGKTLEDLAIARAEFFIQITGTDAVYGQTVHVCIIF